VIIAYNRSKQLVYFFKPIYFFLLFLFHLAAFQLILAADAQAPEALFFLALALYENFFKLI
jgi:hypothetical protein